MSPDDDDDDDDADHPKELDEIPHARNEVCNCKRLCLLHQTDGFDRFATCETGATFGFQTVFKTCCFRP